MDSMTVITTYGFVYDDRLRKEASTLKELICASRIVVLGGVPLVVRN